MEKVNDEQSSANDIALRYMSQFQCMIMAAGRGFPETEKCRREKLEDELETSGLSFVKFSESKNGIDDIYMVINNNIYTHGEFTRLAIRWCMKYARLFANAGVSVTTPEDDGDVNCLRNFLTDSIIVTRPIEGEDVTGIAAITYDKNGKVQQISNFFAEKLFGDFAYVEVSEHMVPDGCSLHSRYGVEQAYCNFRKKYPVFNISPLKANYTRPPVYYILSCVGEVLLDNVEGECDDSRDYEPSFCYNGKRYYIGEFAPYDYFENDVSNYRHTFRKGEYPMILNDGDSKRDERPFIIVLDDERVSIYKEIEVR